MESTTAASPDMTAGVQQLRRQVLGSFAAFGMWWGGWGAVVPAVQNSAGVDNGQLGAALLFVAVGAVASMRSTGWLIDRFGAKVLPAAIVVFALAGFTPALALGTVQLAVALLVVGGGSGAMDVAINTASARYESIAKKPLMSLAHACFSIGVIGGGGAVGALRSAGAGPVVVLGVLAAVLGLLATWLIAPGVRMTQPAADSAADAAPWRWWQPPRRLLILGVLIALAFLVENAWQSWSAVHLERTLDAPPAIGALGPMLFGAAAAIGRLTIHRLTRRFAEPVLVRTGAVLAAAGTLVAATATAPAIALLGIAGAGLGTAGCAPLLFSLAGRGVPERQRGAVIGTVTTLAYLGFVLSPALVGLLARVTSLPTALGAVAAAAGLLAIFAGSARAGPSAPAPDGRPPG